MSKFLFSIHRLRSSRFLAVIFLIFSLIVLHRLFSSSSYFGLVKSPWYRTKETHPIDQLIRDAQDAFKEILSRRTYTLEDAAAAYRRRRGRHPPPAFRLWHEFAAERNPIMVEDFFDQIYHDLEPFWAVDPAKMRQDADNFEMVINVRNGRATTGSDWFWTQIWLDLVREVEHLLPDMDIAMNAMDEPRVLVPWENIAELKRMADKTKGMVTPENAVTGFQNLPPSRTEDFPQRSFEREGPYWQLVRQGCPPDSLARNANAISDFDFTPKLSTAHAAPHMKHGFVSNYTLSTDVCHQPDLRGLEGIFIEPLSIATTQELFPLFGGSKLTVNNDILLPAAMYWSGGDKFTGGVHAGEPWEDKFDSLVWRGVATGGWNKEQNWRGFHRHRFVAMNNGTIVQQAEDGLPPPNFQLPGDEYQLVARDARRLGTWINSWADVAFVDLSCSPSDSTVDDPSRCNYTDPYFDKVSIMPMTKQFRYKYLADVDGNSFSGRYLGFLRSVSLPIKATMWREWHDSRLVAWKHFVPMDNRFVEYYAIMQYFLGVGDLPGHDEEAKMIAMEGKAWADQVLRQEDMQIYTLRLLLEYARVSDERREHMGWVEDLAR